MPLSQKSAAVRGDRKLAHSMSSRYAIIVQSLDDTCTLHPVSLPSTENGTQAWARIKHQACSASCLRRLGNWISVSFITTAVGICTIREVQSQLTSFEFAIPTNNTIFKAHALKPTSESESRKVTIDEYKSNLPMTEAFGDPETLRHHEQYARSLGNFVIHISTRGNLEGQKAIILRETLHKAKIIGLLVSVLVISPGIGIVVGICTHNAEVGVAVSAGVFAMASFLQSLAMWFQA